MPIERRWLKASEAGEYLGLHVKSIYRACKQKQIPCARIPGVGLRVDKYLLDRLLEELGFSSKDFGKILKEGKR